VTPDDNKQQRLRQVRIMKVIAGTITETEHYCSVTHDLSSCHSAPAGEIHFFDFGFLLSQE